jgi:hypothetical protein
MRVPFDNSLPRIALAVQLGVSSSFGGVLTAGFFLESGPLEPSGELFLEVFSTTILG